MELQLNIGTQICRFWRLWILNSSAKTWGLKLKKLHSSYDYNLRIKILPSLIQTNFNKNTKINVAADSPISTFTTSSDEIVWHKNILELSIDSKFVQVHVHKMLHQVDKFVIINIHLDTSKIFQLKCILKIL